MMDYGQQYQEEMYNDMNNALNQERVPHKIEVHDEQYVTVPSQEAIDRQELDKSQRKLISLIEYMDKDQLDFVTKLLTTFSNTFGKGDLMELLELKSGNVDSALPHEYVKKIQDILPEFDTSYNVFDYRDFSHGRMLHLGEALIKLIRQKLD